METPARIVETIDNEASVITEEQGCECSKPGAPEAGPCDVTPQQTSSVEADLAEASGPDGTTHEADISGPAAQDPSAVDACSQAPSISESDLQAEAAASSGAQEAGVVQLPGSATAEQKPAIHRGTSLEEVIASQLHSLHRHHSAVL